MVFFFFLTFSQNTFFPTKKILNDFCLVFSFFQADKVVKDKFEVHRPNMEALSGGGSALAGCMPGGRGGGGDSSTHSLPIARTLRQQMEQVDTVKAERQVIESEFKVRGNTLPFPI